MERRVQSLGICAFVVERVEEEGRGECPEATIHGLIGELGLLSSDPHGTTRRIETIHLLARCVFVSMSVYVIVCVCLCE